MPNSKDVQTETALHVVTTLPPRSVKCQCDGRLVGLHDWAHVHDHVQEDLKTKCIRMMRFSTCPEAQQKAIAIAVSYCNGVVKITPASKGGTAIQAGKKIESIKKN